MASVRRSFVTSCGQLRVVGDDTRLLMGATVIRHRVSGGSRGEQGIVGDLQAAWQDGRVVVDIAAVALALRTLALDHERTRIDTQPVVGPGLGGVVGRVARGCHRQYQVPAKRSLL